MILNCASCNMTPNRKLDYRSSTSKHVVQLKSNSKRLSCCNCNFCALNFILRSLFKVAIIIVDKTCLFLLFPKKRSAKHFFPLFKTADSIEWQFIHIVALPNRVTILHTKKKMRFNFSASLFTFSSYSSEIKNSFRLLWPDFMSVSRILDSWHVAFYSIWNS